MKKIVKKIYSVLLKILDIVFYPILYLMKRDDIQKNRLRFITGYIAHAYHDGKANCLFCIIEALNNKRAEVEEEIGNSKEKDKLLEEDLYTIENKISDIVREQCNPLDLNYWNIRGEAEYINTQLDIQRDIAEETKRKK